MAPLRNEQVDGKNAFRTKKWRRNKNCAVSWTLRSGDWKRGRWREFQRLLFCFPLNCHFFSALGNIDLKMKLVKQCICLMFWRNAMFPREKALIVVEITLFLLAWPWPLSMRNCTVLPGFPNSDLFFTNSWARKSCLCPCVTESGIRLPAALKPILERQGW